MNAFEKHGIKHLSPSSINLWRSEPLLWCGRYLRRWRDDAGPNAWLGSAVEAGLNAWLYKRDLAMALPAAEMEWANKVQGEVSDEIDVSHARLPAMVERAIEAFTEHPTPTSYQAKVECWLDGLPVPVHGYTDWEWPEDIVDLKTTKACPSAPRPDHVMQVATYWQARSREKACRLVYVTEKKHATYLVEPDDMEAALKEMRLTALSLMRFLSRVHDGRDAIALLPADTTSYRWNDNLRALLDAERLAA